MKKFLSKILLVILAISVNEMCAQTQFVVGIGNASPAAIDARQANFGRDVSAQPLLSTPVALVSTTGLCTSAIPASVSGKIALIERTGNLTCNASYIAYKAQVAGAVAVVFSNENSTFVRNLPTRDSAVSATSSTIFLRYSTVNDSSSFVTIPVVSISKLKGDELKASILGGATVTGSIGFNNPVENRVVWGQNGEGSFNGNANGWSWSVDAADTLVKWVWVPNSQALPAPNNALRAPFMESKSYRNGYMVLDAVYHQYRTGTPGSPPYPRFTGWLESPTMNLSSVTKPVVLTFWSKCRELNQTSAVVSYSTDGGTTWIEAADVAAGVAHNAMVPLASEYKRVKLPGAQGSSQVKVRFTFEADFYFWGVDDVNVVEVEDYNLALANNFAARPSNVIYPTGQMDTLNFVADVTNIGGVAQSPKLFVALLDGGFSNLYHLDSLQYPSVNYNDSITDRLFPRSFYANLPDGDYAMIYQLEGQHDDFDEEDNIKVDYFTVGGNEFKKTSDEYLTNSYRPGSTTYTNWGWGNAFYLKNNQPNLNSGRMIADTIKVSMTSVKTMPAGSEIQARLYKVLTTADTIYQTVTPSERELVATAEGYVVTKNEAAAMDLAFDLLDINTGNKYVMSGGTQYIAIVEMSRANTTDTMCFVDASDGDPNYSGMVAASRYARQNPVRLGQILYVGTSSGSTSDFGGVGFGYDVLPNVSLVVNQSTGTNQELSPKAKVKVYPTIATDYVNVEFNFNKVLDGTFEITDLSGKKVKNSAVKGQQLGLHTMDVSNLANGAYFMSVITKEGSRTIKFVVQH